MAQIAGTNVAAPVVPFSTTDVHPSHEAAYGKGGYRSVANTTERNAIPTARREAGMLCYVQADGVIYQLAGDLNTWVALTFAGSLAGLSDAQIENIATGDLLRWSNSKWRNTPEDNVTDGGNF